MVTGGEGQDFLSSLLANQCLDNDSTLSIVQVLGRNISLGAPFRTSYTLISKIGGLVAGWVWGMERCMWAKNRAQQNSPLKLWERNLEVSIIEEESGR